MKKLDYHFLKYNLDTGPRWIGVAWSNDGSTLITTTDCNSYTEAQDELRYEAGNMNCVLKYFQGEYENGPNGFVPVS